MKKYVFYRVLFAILTIIASYAFIFMIVRYSDLVRWTRYIEKKDLWMMAWEELKILTKGIIESNNWGYTLDGDDVWDLVNARIPVSIKINLIAFTFYLIMGMGLGILSAVKKDSWTDMIIQAITIFLGSIPSLVWVMLLLIFLAYKNRFLPGAFNMTYVGNYGMYTVFIIPVLALSFEPIAKITRLVRSELIEAAQSDYNLLCRAKGMKRRQILIRHNMRHILIILLPELGMVFLYALLNSFYIEDIYGVKGIAALFVNNVINLSEDGFQYIQVDAYLLTVISMYVIIFSTTVMLISDLLMGVVDPRIKVHGKKV